MDKPTKMGRNQHKKEENTQNQNTSPPTKDQNSSQQGNKAGWRMSVTKSDFRRWVMRNFHELKEHVLNQAKKLRTLNKDLKKI